MAREPESALGSEDLPALLTSLTQTQSVDDTLALGARLLADVSGARAAAVFLMMTNGILSRSWPSHDPDSDAGIAALLQEAARGMLGPSAGGDHEHGSPSDATAEDRPNSLTDAEAAGKAGTGEVEIKGYPIQSGPQIIGTAVIALPCAKPTGEDRPREQLDTTLGVLTCRLIAHLERNRAVALKNHYERWFNTQDEQIRVLDRERQKFASVVNQTDSYVFVVDKSGTITWTNKAAPVRFPPPDDGAGWVGVDSCVFCRTLDGSRKGNCSDCSIQQALAENTVVHQEIRLAHRDGVRQLYLTAVPIKGPDGRPHEVIVTIQDLTDLDVVRQSERRYRVLFEEGAHALMMVDPDTWRIVLANASAGRTMGCTAEKLARMRLADLHLPSEWPDLKREYHRLLAEPGSQGTECRLRTRDGRERVATVHVQKFDLDRRKLMLLEVHDITERRVAEEALKAAEERLQAVVANSPLVLFALDRDLRFTLSEGKGLEALGLERGQVVGLHVDDVYGEFPRISIDIRRALDGEEFTDMISVGNLTFETWFGPIRDEGGEVAGVVGVATDVTVSQELEKQLRHSQKMQAIGRLAGGVAHDFNNLLTVILGHCDLMIRGMDPDNRWARTAEAIQKAGTRGALLARQLLAFSRREVVAPKVLDLRSLVSDVEPMLRRLLGEDIDIVPRMPDTPVHIKADAGQVEQILMNLAVNARDAMPQGGTLTIEAVPIDTDNPRTDPHVELKPGSYVMLSVSDNGCGMDEDTLEHLFDPFFTTKPMGEGTGLGLSIVYGIVQQYDGVVCAESSPGEGSTIRTYLPRFEEPASVSEPDSEEASIPAGTETILVVEDEDEVRHMTAEVLESQGYTVLQAADAEEALRICKSGKDPIHLVLTDVVMPGHGGAELATWLSEIMPQVKLMFMSGYTDDAVVRHGVLAREHLFIQKPFRLDALFQKVREALDSDPVPANTARRRSAA